MDAQNLDPSVSLLEQIEDQNLDASGGSASLVGWISSTLGNNGQWCTVTVECMRSCIS